MNPVLWQDIEARGVPVDVILTLDRLMAQSTDRELEAAIIIAVVKLHGKRPYVEGDTIPGL